MYGNNDGPEPRARPPGVARAELRGLRLGVVHGTGPSRGRERRCAERFPGPDAPVFGHSHVPWDTTAATAGAGPCGCIGPGSPTDRRARPHRPCMSAEVEAGRPGGVGLHRLPPRR